MASTTSHYGLTKPAANEAYNVGVQNENMDKIDTALWNTTSLSPTSEFSDLVNLSDFLSKVDTLIDAANKKAVVGLGYIVFTGGADKIGLAFSGHAIGFARQNYPNQRCVVVFDNSHSGALAIITKQGGTWGTEWKYLNYTEQVTPTRPSGSKWTSGSITLRKKNGVVMVQMSGAVLSEITTRTTIATAPDGFRPAVEAYFSDDSLNRKFIIKTNGEIIATAQSAGSVYASGMYLT